LKLAEIIQWGRKNPVKFCERFYGIDWLSRQSKICIYDELGNSI
jgi:hypothetical protein